MTAETATIENTVDPCAISSADPAGASTPENYLQVNDQVIEINEDSQQRVEELQAEIAVKNEKLCGANRTIEDLMFSQSTYQLVIAELHTELNEKDQQLAYIEEEKNNIESRYRKVIAKLTAEIAEKSSELDKAKQTISCCVCLDRVVNRIWNECHHVATCEQCAMKLLQDQIGNKVACPKCRTPGFPLEAFI